MGARTPSRYRFGWKYHVVISLLASLGLLLYWYGIVRDAHSGNRDDIWVSWGWGVIIFYVNFFCVWPRAAVRGRLSRWRLLLFTVLNILVIAFVSVAVSMIWGNLELDLEGFRPIDALSLVDGSIRNLYPYSMPHLLSLLASLVAYLIEWVYLPFANRQDTERKIKNARLAWRRAQLDPHLLDTLLVMLRVITRQSQSKAQLALDHAINMVQFYIGGNDPGARIQLADELACMQALVEIQRIRYGSALNWRVETDGNIDGVTVIPMVLMPFAENMVRYAYLDRHDAPATIRIRMADGNLVVGTENRIRIEKDSSAMGTGLANLRERLGYAYPDRHILRTSVDGEWFFTELVIFGIR